MISRDVLDIGKLAALTLVAWLLPPRFWRKAAMATSRIGWSRRYCWPSCTYVLGHKYRESEIADINSRLRGYRRESALQILGLNGRWRAWRPDIRLTGTVHLRRALEGGHGTILWVTESSCSDLIVKMALHNAGYQTHQLSRPGHGFSHSSFGVRFLNPLWTKIEDRFIAERILIVGEYATEAMKTMRERLAANRIVNITINPLAHKLVEVPFFQTHLKLPTGPIQLAKKTGAVLLPIFAFTRRDGGFDVSIQEPLHQNNEQTDIEGIAVAYAKRLEPFVLEYPDQWTGWQWLPVPSGYPIERPKQGMI